MSDIQCRLKNDSLEEGRFETAGCTYQLEIQKRTICVMIFSEDPETLIITYDPEEKVLMELSEVRPKGNN